MYVYIYLTDELPDIEVNGFPQLTWGPDWCRVGRCSSILYSRVCIRTAPSAATGSPINNAGCFHVAVALTLWPMHLLKIIEHHHAYEHMPHEHKCVSIIKKKKKRIMPATCVFITVRFILNDYLAFIHLHNVNVLWKTWPCLNGEP